MGCQSKSHFKTFQPIIFLIHHAPLANDRTQPTGIKQGLRCRILPSNDHRRGIVSFVGEVPDIPGVGAWVGVTLDEPTGKNDGSVNGTKYFSCAPKCGVFLRAERVEIGDFPELSLDDELMSDEEF